MTIHKTFIPLLTILLLIFTGCNDNGSGSDDASAYNGLGIRVVNTGSGELELSQDSDVATLFCYEENGCEEAGGFSFHSIFEEQEMVTDYSEPDREAVGVKVGFYVDAGSGYFEIVTGRPYRDDSDFLEFEEGEVVYASEEFSAETTVSYNYGETN